MLKIRVKSVLAISFVACVQWAHGMAPVAPSLYKHFKLDALQRVPKDVRNSLLAQEIIGPAGWWYQSETVHVDSSVSELAFDKDDTHLAVACNFTQVKVLDSAGNIVWHKNKKFDHEKGYGADIAFHPLTNLLAVAAGAETVDIWNPLQGEPLAVLPQRVAALQHDDIVFAVAYNRQGTCLATGSQEVTLWDTEFKKIKTAPYEFDYVYYLSFSPQGNYLAISDGDLHIWDIETNTVITSPITSLNTSQNNRVGIVQFHPHKNLLATGCGLTGPNSPGELLWDLDDPYGALLRQPAVTFKPRPCFASRSLAFHPKGHLLAIAYVAPGVVLWNLQGERLLRIPHDVVVTKELQCLEPRVQSAVYNSRGTLLATGCGDCRVIQWQQHEHPTLEQVLLRQVIKNYTIECIKNRVKPQVPSGNDDLVPWMVEKFKFNKDELQAVWQTVPAKVQTSIVNTLLYRASKVPYAKK